ncbi:MAG: hypothetical protein ACE5I3_12330 [Phycisphaerae bacterium]
MHRSALFCVALASVGLAFAQGTDVQSDRIARLNRAFLRQVRALGSAHALAAATIAEGWENTYRGELAESFVPDALAVLYPTYREALQAFDEEKTRDVLRLLEPLRDHDDRFLAANAGYFYVRALVALGRYEETEAALASIEARRELYVAHTPYAPHLWLIKGFCEARNLRFEQATRSLQALRAQFSDAPEAVRVGAAQLLLEIERREHGTLGEVATVMDYVADRLGVTDRTQRVRKRQRQIIALLDKLIDQQEQQEQQHRGGSRQRGKGQPSPPRDPQGARNESEAPGGAGRVGDLHAAPQAEPGEVWGKLPPAERERILQSIGAKFPSRYRQLVEQYYRALAEEE